MIEYLPLLAGTAFALAGMLLLMTQVLVVDLSRSYRLVYSSVAILFGHDTAVFPDYTQPNDKL